MNNEQTTVTMTAEEYQEFLRMKKKREKEQAAEKRKGDIEAYKALVDECLHASIPELLGVSEALKEQKETVYARFAEVVRMKHELFGQKDGGQWSHTFSSTDGTMRIRVGSHTLDKYDDTADAGIDMVCAYISGLAGDDPKTRSLVDMVLKLLQKDNKTQQLKASRVLQLDRLAQESGNDQFIEGVSIIKAAYRPEESKRYIVAEIKNPETNKWEPIPLGMTEA